MSDAGESHSHNGDGHEPPSYSFSTRVVHAGLPPAEAGQPFLPGPMLAAPFHLPGNPAETRFGYSRNDNPTWAAYEQALAELDGATRATVFASGMAACSAVLLSTLRPGDLLVAASDGYPVVRHLAQTHLTVRGVDVRFCQTDGPWDLDGATLVWIESPSNPQLRTTDVEALAAKAHATGALVALDNTLLTPLGQRPLELGADFAVYSDTKAMSGHSDLLIGHVATTDEALGDQIRSWRTQTGAVPGPFEVWLAHRSLATLDLRLQRQCFNAAAVADALHERGDVEDIRTAGMLVVFTLADAERAQRFLSKTKLVLEATSFGGIHSSAERRARWDQGDEVPPGFIRFSAGIEDTQDLVTDVISALDD